jgi:hypothetical protein
VSAGGVSRLHAVDWRSPVFPSTIFSEKDFPVNKIHSVWQKVEERNPSDVDLFMTAACVRAELMRRRAGKKPFTRAIATGTVQGRLFQEATKQKLTTSELQQLERELKNELTCRRLGYNRFQWSILRGERVGTKKETRRV